MGTIAPDVLVAKQRYRPLSARVTVSLPAAPYTTGVTIPVELNIPLHLRHPGAVQRSVTETRDPYVDGPLLTSWGWDGFGSLASICPVWRS